MLGDTMTLIYLRINVVPSLISVFIDVSVAWAPFASTRDSTHAAPGAVTAPLAFNDLCKRIKGYQVFESQMM